MNDHDYAYWHACLAGEKWPHPDAPQFGRYRLPARMTNTTGNVNIAPPYSRPVAIWEDPFTGKKMVRVGKFPDMIEDSDRYLSFVDSGWPQCKAVTEEQYQAVIAGGSWPDEHEAVTRMHNAPPTDDSLEALTDRIDDLAREADKLIALGAAKSEEESNRAADLANLLGQMEKKADELRRVEKKPHEDAAKDVDRQWCPVRDKAKDAKVNLKARVCTPFLEAQRREAERLAAEERKRQREAAQLGEPQAAPIAPPVKTTAGTRGRPVSLRTIKIAEIVDYDSALLHFAQHAEIRDIVTTLANRAARAGIDVPGVRIIETHAAA